MAGSHKVFDYLDGFVLLNHHGLALLCLLFIAVLWTPHFLRRGPPPAEVSDRRSLLRLGRRTLTLLAALPVIAIATFYGSALASRLSHADDVTTGCVLGVSSSAHRQMGLMTHSFGVIVGGRGFKFSDDFLGDGLASGGKPFPIKPQTTIEVRSVFDHVVRVDQLADGCNQGAPIV